MSHGLVEIRREKSTFVAAPKITQELKELSAFVEDIHALDCKPIPHVHGGEIVTAIWHSAPYYDHQNNTGKKPNQQLNQLGLIANFYFTATKR